MLQLRMETLKSNIESRSVGLVKFLQKELDEVIISITINFDVKVILSKVDNEKFSITVHDTITNEKFDYGTYEYYQEEIKSTEMFLKIEKVLLNLFGEKMFFNWVNNQLQRTKGRKKLITLICETNQDKKQVERLFEDFKSNSEEIIDLLKPAKVKFCHCELMSTEYFQIQLGA